MNEVTKIERPGIVAALAKALPELESAKKNKANPAFKSKYADLAAMIEAIEPIAKHGLWFRQVTIEHADGACVETFYIHDSGEQLSAGITFTPASKRDAQGFGSALTYCRRYALQTAFGLAVEDDDGNAASKAPPAKPEYINDAQWAEITSLMQATNADAKGFCTAFKIGSIKELTVADFPRAKAALETKLKKMADAEKEAA
jgi:hypothetical protein